MRKVFLAVIATLLLVGIGFAQDTAIITTDVTSVDAATASAAAEQEGAPVLTTENGEVTDETISELQASGVTDVVIVGGPAVVETETETRLKARGFRVVRIWGFERTGTAIETARHFWPEGASCAVLVSDTKDSDADSRRQLAASNLAARHNCTFLPIPEGTLPAEVLDLLNDLGVQQVIFVGRSMPSEIREKLREFRLREVTGDDDEIEDEVEEDVADETTREGRKPKLVIVATPDWKAAIAVGAHPNKHSVVRHLTSVDEAADVIAFIQKHNITDVRVVGIPDLAQQIADRLSSAGINATVVSGQKAHEIARKLFKNAAAEWVEEEREAEARKIKFRLKIKAFLNQELNDTLARLDAALAELDAMATSADAENAKSAIDAAKARIAEIRSLLAAGSVDAARRLLFEIRFKADEKRFELRDKLRIRIQDHVEDEEDDVDEAQADADEDLSAVESRLSEIRTRCANTDIIDAIVAKAKVLRTSMQEARAAGNFTGESRHLVQVRELVHLAKSVSEACRQHGVLPTVTTAITEREKIEVETKSETSVETSGSSETSVTSGSSPKTVEITAEGFKPNTLTIKAGETVTWTNKDTSAHWPASAVHPAHLEYPENTGKCAVIGGSDFDACGGLSEGKTWSFTFNKVGTWKYHDHLHTTFTGAITVE